MDGVTTSGFDRRLKRIGQTDTPGYFDKAVRFEYVPTDNFQSVSVPGFANGAVNRLNELQRRAGTPARKTANIAFECEFGYHSFSESAGWTLLGRASTDLAVLTKGHQFRLDELADKRERKFRVFNLPEKRKLVDVLRVNGEPLRLVLQLCDTLGGRNQYEHCILVPTGDVQTWKNDPISPAKRPKSPPRKRPDPSPSEGRSWFFPVVLTLGAIGGGVALAVHFGVLEIPDGWTLWRMPTPVVPLPAASDPILIVRPPPPLGFPRGRN